MPFEPSVVHQGGYDYWRTWFIDECEASQLFGLTKRHLGLVTLDGAGLLSYRVGTKLYLEDAPYFRGANTHHRVCGPYEVFSLQQFPDNAEVIHTVNQNIIVFKVLHPEQGPWLNRTRVTREIDGITVKFDKIADRFGYFPYRFAIRRARAFRVQHIQHERRDCWLCR